MNAQDFRSLQEAYLEVVENQQLDEEEAPVRKRGGRSAPEGERSIPGQPNRDNKDYWASVIGKNRDRGEGSAAKRRAAALNKEEVDIYDIILSHLLDEGYAETPEAAEAIMVNMSEEWRDGILEDKEEEKDKNPSETGLRGDEPKKMPKGWRPTGPKRRYGERPGWHR